MVSHTLAPFAVRRVVALVAVVVGVASVSGCETVGRACDSACGSFFDSLTDSCGGAPSSPDETTDPSQSTAIEGAAPAVKVGLDVEY